MPTLRALTVAALCVACGRVGYGAPGPLSDAARHDESPSGALDVRALEDVLDASDVRAFVDSPEAHDVAVDVQTLRDAVSLFDAPGSVDAPSAPDATVAVDAPGAFDVSVSTDAPSFDARDSGGVVPCDPRPGCTFRQVLMCTPMMTIDDLCGASTAARLLRCSGECIEPGPSYTGRFSPQPCRRPCGDLVVYAEYECCQ